MGSLDLLRAPDINDGVAAFRNTPGAVLLDVRTVEEYRQRHISGSLNIPLDRIQTAPDQIPDRSTPLFVHCLSGARSSQAVAALGQMGYTNVTNIGGISRYQGERV